VLGMPRTSATGGDDQRANRSLRARYWRWRLSARSAEDTLKRTS
jgi:hypothetical protein